MIYEQTPEDLIIWPCGTWTKAEYLPDYSHKSDDYIRMSPKDPAYEATLKCLEYGDA